MKKAFLILGLITAILALVLATLPVSNLAFIPGVIALACGFLALYFAKRAGTPLKTVQLVFLLSVIAMAMATYKSLFTTAKMGNTEELEKREQQSQEEAIEELEELDLEELEGIDSELENIAPEELEELNNELDNELENIEIEEIDL
ncbi:FUSC family protein [Mangrovimonas yunxiaonensis]|uniref:FUSC family protein n=1 Tax=Mangrovimonas yunxiaonensis TaxID=1197477 RepID=UPI000AC0C547|nr:FUSC family protein [Mangrovimonas yunxiaonensis]GGH43321.1 hypothetical protein GCM10011364_15440 [Mangrovimonas yunxiaonensis]